MMGSDTADQATLAEPERLCCDALAELFLGETGRPAPEPGAHEPDAHDPRAHQPASEPEALAGTEAPSPPAERSSTSAVEAVLAGHLPVIASAWVSQYARGVAAKTGPVGLIRAGEGRLSVEMVGDRAARPQTPPASAQEAVRRLRPRVKRWLIQADDACAGALLDRGEVDCLTLLCSADEAALVAGYRMVKDLLEPRLELAAPMGAVHIAIAGRADPQAMAAAERLSRAAERFLGVETTVAIGAARIEAGASASWFEGSGATPELVAELVGELVEELAGSPAGGAGDVGTRAAAPGAEHAGPPPIASTEINGHGQSDDADGAPAIFGPAFDATLAPAAASNDVLSTPTRHPTPTPTPDPTPAAAAPPAPAEPAAADTPEAAPERFEGLLLQCPRAPAIEFRVEDGRIVAIADARSLGMDLALRHLVVACAWAAEHDALITQATGHSGRVAQRVLLVEDAPAARHLLDADIRVRVAASGRGEIPLN